MADSPAAHPRTCALARALAAVVLLVALWPTLGQWPTLEARLRQSLADGSAGRTQPRFWSHGRLTPM